MNTPIQDNHPKRFQPVVTHNTRSRKGYPLFIIIAAKVPGILTQDHTFLSSIDTVADALVSAYPH